MSIRLVRAVIAGLTLMCAPPLAAAGSPARAGDVRVAYGDLDLGDEAGAAAMLNRLREAAAEICGGRYQAVRELRLRRELRTCTQDIVDDAVARLDSPVVTAVHAKSQPDTRRVAEREHPRG